MSKLIRIHLQSTFFTYVPKTFACFSFKFILACGTQLIDLSSPRIVTHYFAKKPLEKYFRGPGGVPLVEISKTRNWPFWAKNEICPEPSWRVPDYFGSLRMCFKWSQSMFGIGLWPFWDIWNDFWKRGLSIEGKNGPWFFCPNTYLVKFFLCFQKCSVWWVTHNQQ